MFETTNQWSFLDVSWDITTPIIIAVTIVIVRKRVNGTFRYTPTITKPHDSWLSALFSCVKSQVVVCLKPKVGNALDVARELQSQVDHAYLGMAALTKEWQHGVFKGCGRIIFQVTLCTSDINYTPSGQHTLQQVAIGPFSNFGIENCPLEIWVKNSPPGNPL